MRMPMRSGSEIEFTPLKLDDLPRIKKETSADAVIRAAAVLRKTLRNTTKIARDLTEKRNQ